MKVQYGCTYLNQIFNSIMLTLFTASFFTLLCNSQIQIMNILVNLILDEEYVTCSDKKYSLSDCTPLCAYDGWRAFSPLTSWS